MNYRQDRSIDPHGCPPKYSPWGKIETIESICPGAWWVYTSSHGGVKLSAANQRRIPEVFRQKGGWYEEDCNWAIPFHFLPEAAATLEAKDAERVVLVLKRWRWREFESHFGVVLEPGESSQKDQYVFSQEHKNDWVTISAWGDWYDGGNDWAPVPKGFVGVVATLGGLRWDPNDCLKSARAGVPYVVTKRKFLIPSLEYDARGCFGFVVDPARHQEWKNKGDEA